jgi:hypothetical protein
MIIIMLASQLLRAMSLLVQYVLGLRWDCEKSAQIWQSCADLTIVA